jgi:hypothetical protein
VKKTDCISSRKEKGRKKKKKERKTDELSEVQCYFVTMEWCLVSMESVVTLVLLGIATVLFYV